MSGSIRLPVYEHEHDEMDTKKRTSRYRYFRSLASGFIGIALLSSLVLYGAESTLSGALNVSGITLHDNAMPHCPVQVDPLVPEIAFKAAPGAEYAGRLSQAVKIPTVSYDDNGTPEDDPRWQFFHDFHKWLFTTYPAVFIHSAVSVTKINTLAILTEIKGSDSTLKPLMLTSHQDVVPVEKRTLNRWTYPPFDGVYDEEYVHGRGAFDDKSLLVSQYEALSQLLSSGWTPRRSIVLAHGFDEESVQARQGAGELSKHLLATYGPDSMLMIIDEGATAERLFGTAYATPATSEKGYVDVQITVGTLGGHSSVPPPHTGIGIMSDVIREIEKHPWEASYAGATDPLLQFAMCVKEHSREPLPKIWNRLIKKRDWKGLAKEFAKNSLASKALVTTTQAVDIVQGGVKVNALPELVTAVVNHRIAFSHSIADVKEHLTRVVVPIAKRHNMSYYPFDEPEKLGNRYIKLEVQGNALEPAPRSPTSGGVWDLFAGSIRQVHKDEKNEGKPYIVSPFASTGNTDTKVYWNLTRNIYRYFGSPVSDYQGNVHTADEKISVHAHIKTVEWIHTIVQNADAYNDA